MNQTTIDGEYIGYRHTYGEHGPVVLIHGNASSGDSWWSTQDALSPTYETYALDLPGSGGSSYHHRIESLRSLGGMVAEFVGEIGKRCSLWGWSAGCGVGLHAAAQSDQIDRMILMGPHGPDGYGITPFNAYRLLVSSVLDPDFTEFYRSGWENENTAEITQSVLDFEMPTNLRGQSTLVLRGSNDAISTDRMADEMVEAIRNRGGLSDKIEIPGAGHSPHTENMDRTLEAVTNYLSKFRR